MLGKIKVVLLQILMLLLKFKYNKNIILKYYNKNYKLYCNRNILYENI